MAVVVRLGERAPARRGRPRVSPVANARARRAFEEEALGLADHVYRVAQALVGSRAEAEELMQETYAKAFRSWRAFTSGADLRVWLLGILTSLERDGRQDAAEERPREEGDYFLYDRLGESNGEANVGRLAEIERLPRDGVVEALAVVPHEERDALVLVDVGEFSHADAARILGLPLEALLRRLHRGRRILKSRLAGEIGAVV